MVKFGFLSTYPPTLSGPASFTAALRAALPSGAAGGVVRLVESPEDRATPAPDGVAGELVAGSASSCLAAAVLLDQNDIAIIQYDQGVGGEDVLRVLAALTVPAVIVLRAVLTAPTAQQRTELNEVAASAAAIVVMSDTARMRLLAGYDVHAARVAVIPHGAKDFGSAAAVPHRSQKRQILTWGLLRPGKGIEWAIEAMALLGDLRPAARYVVAGRTHPKVLAREGNRYRDSLVSRAVEFGVAEQVHFDSRYLGPESLRRLVSRSEVVLLPYDSLDQVTSGVLIEAITSRTPVVATRFPHAVELLSGGCGVLVGHRDPTAMAKAIRRILTNKAAARTMATAAGLIAVDLGWASVAGRYCQLGAELTQPVLTSFTGHQSLV